MHVGLASRWRRWLFDRLPSPGIKFCVTRVLQAFVVGPSLLVAGSFVDPIVTEKLEVACTFTSPMKECGEAARRAYF